MGAEEASAYDSGSSESSSSSSTSENDGEQQGGFDTTHASSTDNLMLEELARQENQFAERENKQVKCWRKVVVLSILFAGALLSTLTFLALNQEKVKESNDAVSTALACFEHLLRPQIRSFTKLVLILFLFLLLLGVVCYVCQHGW